MRTRGPLRSATYLLRNKGKSLPLVGVIVLAVMLVSGIVSMMDSIPLSIRTIYSYSRHYAGLTPRGDPTQTERIKETVEQESPVKPDRIMYVRGLDLNVMSIVGKWPFVIIALKPEDFPYYMEHVGPGKLDGRLPRPGEAAVVLSEPVMRNLHVKLGDIILGPDKPEAYSPNEVRVVGMVHSPEWVAAMPYDYVAENHFPPVDALLVFAKDADEQRQFDHWAEKRFTGERARVFAYHKLEKDTAEMFNILYKILDVVIGLLVVVITIMMGMLISIFLAQRVQEFGLLQALGYTKRAILGRVMGEMTAVVVGGWVAGVLVAYALLNVVKASLMDPRAFMLDPLDRTAYMYTLPVPVAIYTVALATVLHRFRTFDPVAVVERRVV
ncbi:MAG: FtsX-like permease family protein [Fimbriimonadaceae bacterium]|nr:FtsX-like permease family protein [Fimbriimonadaceae bacterium]